LLRIAIVIVVDFGQEYARRDPPAKLIEWVSKFMDLARKCQISSHRTAIISALIIVKELRALSMHSTAQAIFRISRSPDDSYTDDKVPLKIDMFFLFPDSALGSYYWKFLNHPGRCGVLYHERAKCYTRIVNFWLLFLEASPDPKAPDSRVYEECRKIVLTNWSRLLSKCVPGDKDLICRLRDFTLDKACKEDVENVHVPVYRTGKGTPANTTTLQNVIEKESMVNLVRQTFHSSAGPHLIQPPGSCLRCQREGMCKHSYPDGFRSRDL